MRMKGGYGVRMRLEREAGRTRFYLANTGIVPIDSLAFFFQAASYAPPVFDSDYWRYPVFTEAPVAEYRGTLHRLAPGKEADLGLLPGDYPAEMDRLSLLFIPLYGSVDGQSIGTEEGGYYEGRFRGRNVQGTPCSGSARGVVSASGGFWFWMRDDGADRVRTLSGELFRDTVQAARMDGSAWRYMASDSARKILFLPAEAPDSARFEIPFSYDFPSPPDTAITFGLALSRRPLVRWDPPVTSGIVIWEPSR
jgi:hypothetical protein